MWLISPSNTGSLVIPAAQTQQFQLRPDLHLCGNRNDYMAAECLDQEALVCPLSVRRLRLEADASL